MDVLYWVIPLTIGIGFILTIILMYTIKDGQYNDLKGESERILFDEDLNDENDDEKVGN
jgi:cbb3-type cytochrome oxidase maturation protein